MCHSPDDQRDARTFDLIGQAIDDILRLQPEFIQPAMQMARAGLRQTVVFFGSARVQPPEIAQARLDALEERFSKIEQKTQQHWDEMDRLTDAVYMSRFYAAAEELAARLARWTLQRGIERELVVATGGGPGIMEAANKGALEAGVPTAGFGIKIPTEQKPNDYITPELLYYFDSFLTRKFWLLFPARALVVFPGGIGTLDELFEVYTLMKARKATRPIPIVLYGREYWEELIHFPTMVRFGTIDASDLDFLHHTDCVEDAFEYITQRLE